jgi:hypothetical protein
VQPTDPDDRPTQPLDDIWAAPRPDTVDSAAPPAASDGARRGLRVVGVAGAVLALVAAGAFGALLAGGGGDDSAALTGIGATSDEDGTDEDGTEEDGTDEDEGTLRERLKGRGPFGHGLGGPGVFAGGFLGRGLHGSFVVEDPDGGYQTVLTQHGTATSVSDTSITVKSDDGFVATYRLTDESAVLSGPSGTEAIAEGADVAVTAVKTGSTARAVHVVDLSQVRERFEHHFDDDAPGSTDGGTPAPSGTATSGASV